MDDATNDRRSAAFTMMVRAATGDATRLAALARAAVGAGQADQAYPLAKAARNLAPDDPAIAATTHDAYVGDVPGWHFAIVSDVRRNAAYDAAIRRAVSPESRVLDIGAGTGILAMMAARAGASEVLACEMNPAVADAASDIVTANGLNDRVRVIARKSTALDVEGDLGGPVDLLVSEIVSNDVLAQDVLTVMADAVARLLKPGGRMIPEAATAMVALAELPSWDRGQLRDADGFDVSAFNRLRRLPLKLPANADVRLRSTALPLYRFDFTRGGDWPAQRAHVVARAIGGRVNGVLLWMRLHLDAETTYEVEATSPATASWAVLFWPLAEARYYPAGSDVRIDGAHDGLSIRLWVDQPADQ